MTLCWGKLRVRAAAKFFKLCLVAARVGTCQIAAVDGKGGVGPTTTAGPYRIDMLPPSDVSVTAPEITSVRTITLTLKAQGASEVYVSKLSHEHGGRWEHLTDQKEWEFTPGNGKKYGKL